MGAGAAFGALLEVENAMFAGCGHASHEGRPLGFIMSFALLGCHGLIATHGFAKEMSKTEITHDRPSFSPVGWAGETMSMLNQIVSSPRT
jgi:hypothetical protein